MRCFVESVLCSSWPSVAPAGDQDCTALQLLWRLAVQHGRCRPIAARKACDILLWALASPSPGLSNELLRHLVVSCSGAELLERLSAARSPPGGDKPSLLLHRERCEAAALCWVSAGFTQCA